MSKIMEDMINEAKKEQTREQIQKMLKRGKTPEEIIDFCAKQINSRVGS